MSLVFYNIEDSPQIHALVIGVGGYRYLHGGTEQKDQVYESVGILKQLSSPPRSAHAFRTFLEEKHLLWKAPLGSIELLISPSPDDPDPDGSGTIYDPATIENIQTAYNNWKERCNKNEDNIAVFFFSGHGVEKLEHYLLAEDFGKNPNNPWLGSFTFDSTRRAFQSCKASTQCFFIDACRKVISSMLTRNLPEVPLDVEDYTNSTECMFDLTLKGAVHNEVAHGKKYEPSYFTRALLFALNGGAANNTVHGWAVETGQIAVKINEILEMVKPDSDNNQRCKAQISSNTYLLQLNELPDVEMRISCQPEEVHRLASLSYHDINETIPAASREPKPEPWNINVKAGIYRIKAKFYNNEYPEKIEIRSATPPLITVPINCQT